MSFPQDTSKKSAKYFEMDGSDGQDQQPKSQADYVVDIKAHLAAAHAALRHLTGATLEDLSSDPELHPAYLGCVRELLGFGFGNGTGLRLGSGRKGLSAEPGHLNHPAPSSQKKVGAGRPAVTTVVEKLDAPVSSSSTSHFTIHFLPDGAFNGKRPDIEPSVFDQRLAMLLEGSLSLRNVSVSGKCWTSRGDLVMSTSKSQYLSMETMLLGLSVGGTIAAMFDDNWKATYPTTYRLRIGGETSCYLRIRDIPDAMFPARWWTSRGAEIQECLATAVLDSLNVMYVLPQYYIQAHGTTVPTGMFKMDVFIGLSGVTKAAVDSLQQICPSTIKSVSLPNKPFTVGVLKSMFPLGEWKGRNGLYNLSISFLEFKDEVM